jgi:signal transduction histidine kinase
MLMFILLIAMIFTILYVLFISQSISKPIKKLCVFADEIGHGNFARNEYSFSDRELVDLNRRMNETAEKLEKNDENQKTFFQNVSHELKTPLMYIRGYAEGIKYGVFERQNDKNNAADIIISESERLNDLVADLLYISKIDSSNNFVVSQKVNLVELSEICADKLRGLLINQEKNKNKKIEIIYPEKAVYIDCDEENLMRALMNIVANGIQYAKTNVEISFYETERSVFLYIKDDGPGIPEEDLPDIFKRFYKGSAGKHGIGLSIAKSIIEQHGAQITAINRTDETGAEFIIEFAI